MSSVSSLPTGTVTFLFTDIEGSTAIWEQHPKHMSSALARHDALLRRAIVDYGGYVFKTVGDAFCAAFSNTLDALNAILATNRSLHDEVWGETGVIGIRAAIHTGIAQERDGDYYGQPLNRVARLMSAGHGGQILLSQPAYELVRDNLPAGAQLRDMGEHRLKDLIRPEHIYQVVIRNLPADFPPLKTLNYRPNNLPAQPTALIGREKELADIRKLLGREDVRLVTLTGPGGIGKTRLALQAAADLLDEHADGVWFVNLAPVTDHGLVVSTIAQTLEVKEVGGQPLLDILKSYLKEKHLLLVVDNFEQVISAATSISDLLATCCQLKVLTTSRIALRLRGEREYSVPTLHMPDPKHMPALDTLTQYEAVRLFIERAQGVKADFEVDNDNAPAVAEICARLDGLPLAIELAAVRVRLFPPHALLGRLGQRLKLLTGGARDMPERQQTLRSTIEWSYDLLAEGERQLFRRLAVFQGGNTFEAAEAVCNFDLNLEIELLDGIASLLSKSLLKQKEGVAGESRFYMLETIHEYARDKLVESGEEENIKREYRQYFLRIVQDVEPHLTGKDQVVWLNRLEEEYDNLRAVLDWGMSSSGDPLVTLQFTKNLWRFWVLHNHFTEGCKWIEAALEHDNGSVPVLSAWLHYALSIVLHFQNHTWALSHLEQALPLFKEVGDRQGIAWCMNDIGSFTQYAGDLPRAEELFEQSLQIKRELGDPRDIAIALSNLGELARWKQDYRRAIALMNESLAIQRSVEDKYGLSITLNNLAYALHNQGDYEQAMIHFNESLLLSRELGSAMYVAGCLAGIAGVLASQGRMRRAARLFAATEPILANLNAGLDPSDNRDYAHNLSMVRTQLTEAELDKAWREGRGMSMEQAISYALEGPDE